jgi:hypothetical protein
MNIEEVLIKYTDLTLKRNKAYEEQKNLEILMQEVLYKNEDPLHLHDAEGNLVGITIQTPYSLQTMTIGFVIAVADTEWMRLPDNWVNCYGVKFTDNQMFVSIMHHRDNIHLIHRAY